MFRIDTVVPTEQPASEEYFDALVDDQPNLI